MNQLSTQKTPQMLKLEEMIGEPLEQWLEHKHCKEYFSFNAISQEINKKYNKKITEKTVSGWFNELNIKRLPLNELMLRGKKLPSKEELDNLYNKERKGILKIAKEWNVNYKTIYNLFDKYGMQRRTKQEASLKGRQKPSDEELYILRVIEGMNFTEISKKYGFGLTTVSRWCKKIKVQPQAKYFKPWLDKYGVLTKINKK